MFAELTEVEDQPLDMFRVDIDRLRHVVFPRDPFSLHGDIRSVVSLFLKVSFHIS